MKKHLLIAIILLLVIVTLTKINKSNKSIEKNKTTTTINTQVITTTSKMTKKQTTTKKSVKKTTTTTQQNAATGTYKLTHYGWDCCKSGKTATGYNVKNTIYYNDKEYGKVRIVAMCSKVPLYSIVKIKDYKITKSDIKAIVIDRGVNCSTIDLLVENEAKSSKLGIQKGVEVEILRSGKGE